MPLLRSTAAAGRCGTMPLTVPQQRHRRALDVFTSCCGISQCLGRRSAGMAEGKWMFVSRGETSASLFVVGKSYAPSCDGLYSLMSSFGAQASCMPTPNAPDGSLATASMMGPTLGEENRLLLPWPDVGQPLRRTRRSACRGHAVDRYWLARGSLGRTRESGAARSDGLDSG